jgi:hypothetical protein
MRTVGVDLSAEPKKTAVAVVEWSPGEALVSSVDLAQTDEDIAAACEHAHKVGIDCPLGWPEPFIDFVTAHRDGKPLKAHDLAGRQDLAYRMTDLVLIDDKSGRPLSVSTDRIGRAAMRAAGLLALLARDPPDRSGRQRSGRRGLPGGGAQTLEADPPQIQGEEGRGRAEEADQGAAREAARLEVCQR